MSFTIGKWVSSISAKKRTRSCVGILGRILPVDEFDATMPVPTFASSATSVLIDGERVADILGPDGKPVTFPFPMRGESEVTS